MDAPGLKVAEHKVISAETSTFQLLHITVLLTSWSGFVDTASF